MPIDLRSDTVTRPTPGMRRAMAEAEVGDDYLDGDPTTGRLEAAVAEREESGAQRLRLVQLLALLRVPALPRGRALRRRAHRGRRRERWQYTRGRTRSP